MKKNFLLSCMLVLFAATPVCAALPDHDSVAPLVHNPVTQGASDALLKTFPLASSLVGYGWAQSGLVAMAKTLGVDISVLIGILALRQAGTSADVTGKERPAQSSLSYYAGCAAGVGVLGLLLAYKSCRCNESAFSILLKTGLSTLVSRITGAALHPLLKKTGMAEEAEMSVDILKHIFVDTRITAAIQNKLLPVPTA